MNDVLIGAWHGGLGDCLQFSTLPEEFYKQQGRETYVAAESHFRNKEIYDLVWGCNPYIKGVKEGKRNAGDIPEIEFTNEHEFVSSIPNWEYLHGLKPTNKYPKIYYRPKRYDWRYENTILVDLSSISLKHDGNKSQFPPAYDANEVKEKYETLRRMFPEKEFAAIKFRQDLGTNTFSVRTDSSIQVDSIFHYCDLMNSAYGIIGLYSGQSALSCAIMEYNPKLMSICIVSEAVYKKHTKQSGFIFDNLEYVIIPETTIVQDTSIH